MLHFNWTLTALLLFATAVAARKDYAPPEWSKNYEKHESGQSAPSWLAIAFVVILVLWSSRKTRRFAYHIILLLTTAATLSFAIVGYIVVGALHIAVPLFTHFIPRVYTRLFGSQCSAAEIRQLQDRLSRIEVELSKSHRQQHIEEELCMKADQNLANKTKALNDLKYKKDAADVYHSRETCSLKELIANRTAENDDLRADKDELECKVEELGKRILADKLSNDVSLGVKDVVIAKKEQALQVADGLLSNCLKEKNGLSEEIETLQTALRQHENEKATLCDGIKTLEMENKTARGTVECIKSKDRAMLNDKRAIDALSVENEALKGANNNLCSEAIAHRADVERHTKENATLMTTNMKLNEQIAKLGKAKALEVNITTPKADEFKDRYEKLLPEYRQLREQKGCLDRKLAAMTRAASMKDKKIADLEKSVGEMQQQISEESAQAIVSATKLRTTTKKYIAEKQEKIAAFEAIVVEKDHEIATLRRQLEQSAGSVPVKEPFDPVVPPETQQQEIPWAPFSAVEKPSRITSLVIENDGGSESSVEAPKMHLQFVPASIPRVEGPSRTTPSAIEDASATPESVLHMAATTKKAQDSLDYLFDDDTEQRYPPYGPSEITTPATEDEGASSTAPECVSTSTEIPQDSLDYLFEDDTEQRSPPYGPSGITSPATEDEGASSTAPECVSTSTEIPQDSLDYLFEDDTEQMSTSYGPSEVTPSTTEVEGASDDGQEKSRDDEQSDEQRDELSETQNFPNFQAFLDASRAELAAKALADTPESSAGLTSAIADEDQTSGHFKDAENDEEPLSPPTIWTGPKRPIAIPRSRIRTRKLAKELATTERATEAPIKLQEPLATAPVVEPMEDTTRLTGQNKLQQSSVGVAEPVAEKAHDPELSKPTSTGFNWSAFVFKTPPMTSAAVPFASILQEQKQAKLQPSAFSDDGKKTNDGFGQLQSSSGEPLFDFAAPIANSGDPNMAHEGNPSLLANLFGQQSHATPCGISIPTMVIKHEAPVAVKVDSTIAKSQEDVNTSGRAKDETVIPMGQTFKPARFLYNPSTNVFAQAHSAYGIQQQAPQPRNPTSGQEITPSARAKLMHRMIYGHGQPTPSNTAPRAPLAAAQVCNLDPGNDGQKATSTPTEDVSKDRQKARDEKRKEEQKAKFAAHKNPFGTPPTPTTGFGNIVCNLGATTSKTASNPSSNLFSQTGTISSASTAAGDSTQQVKATRPKFRERSKMSVRGKAKLNFLSIQDEVLENVSTTPVEEKPPHSSADTGISAGSVNATPPKAKEDEVHERTA